MMQQSGYYDDLLGPPDGARRVGAWYLEYGQLPDGRWAVDYYSDAAPRKQRHYFDAADEARDCFESFGRKLVTPSV